MDLVVVGSGFFGLTITRQAAEAGRVVTVLERRDRIDGNAWSSIDPETGTEVHRYGTYLFHTSDERVWAYVNRFISFNSYQHRVYANHGGIVYSLPINLDTISQFFASAYTPDEARALIAEQATELGDTEPVNLEEKAVSLIGRPLCEVLIRGYTYKQWQTDPKDLNASIISRLPVRFTYDNRYFRGTHEGLPLDGYAAWLERLVDHENIEVLTGHDFFDETHPYSKSEVVDQTGVICTGALDRYLNYELGSLAWRTLDFESEAIDTPDFQGCSVMNYSDESVPFTRVHEFAHLHLERERTGAKSTFIMREFSRFTQAGDEPYYPVDGSADREMLVACRDLVAREDKVVFGGCLGSCKYFDVHMAIESVLNRFDKIVSTW